MRQQSGLLQHQVCHLGDIVDGGFAPEFGQGFPRDAIPKFWLVTQREQGFFAARLLSCPSHIEHLVARHVRVADIAWGLRIGAIVANVPAQTCQRNKDLAGVADDTPMTLIAKIASRLHHRAHVGFPHG